MEKFGAPFDGGWMNWPAGWVEKLAYTDNVNRTLTAYLNHGTVPKDPDTVEHQIVEKWMNYAYGK